MRKRVIFVNKNLRDEIKSLGEDLEILIANEEIDRGNSGKKLLVDTISWHLAPLKQKEVLLIADSVAKLLQRDLFFERSVTGRVTKALIFLQRKEWLKILALCKEAARQRESLEDLMQKRLKLEKLQQKASKLWKQFIAAEGEEKAELKKAHAKIKEKIEKKKKTMDNFHKACQKAYLVFDSFMESFYEINFDATVLIQYFMPISVIETSDGKIAVTFSLHKKIHQTSSPKERYEGFLEWNDAINEIDIKSVDKEWREIAKEAIQKEPLQEIAFKKVDPILENYGLFKDDPINIDSSIEIKARIDAPLAPTTSSLASSMIASGILGDIHVEDEDPDDGHFIARTALVQMERETESVIADGRIGTVKVISWEKILGVYYTDKRSFSLLK